MRKVCTGAAMREADQFAIQVLKIPGLLLMESASRAVAQEIINRAKNGDRVLVLCGGGNNGGDGMAAARMLKQAGLNVKVYCIADAGQLKGDALINYEMLASYKIPVIRPDQVYVIENMIAQTEWIVDALFGTGLDREIDGIVRQLIQSVNNMHQKGDVQVVSVDIPSGIHADSGMVMGCAVQADITVTFAQMKAGLLLYPGHDYAGKVIVADIGMPAGVPSLERTKGFTLEKSDIAELLPKRYSRSHKGSYGRLLVAAGSKNMTGAAVLSANAAYKMGTGLVDMVIPKDVRSVIQCLLPEVVITPYDIIRENVDHGSMIEEQDMASIREAVAISSAVLMGPGWSQVSYVKDLMNMMLDTVPAQTPLVLDADALNLLAGSEELQRKLIHRNGQKPGTTCTILTPHLGEASRLLKKPVSEIAARPVEAVLELTKKYNACVALKDAMTIVASPDEQLYFNQTGNHGMATAGSGDVLAGIIAGLAAQGVPVYRAAYLGVYLHGAAGDMAAKQQGCYAMTASDICAAIHPETLAGLV